MTDPASRLRCPSLANLCWLTLAEVEAEGDYPASPGLLALEEVVAGPDDCPANPGLLALEEVVAGPGGYPASPG
jgi:hypothetical protein